MKKFYILFLLFALCPAPHALCQQYGWTDISANIPGTPNFSDVFFVSDDEGWIVSNYPDPIIYHTTDGGNTFEVQTTLLTCNAIWMLNENEGYAGGASGFIYRTTDGGTNWNFHGTMAANLADISFPPTGETGYCCGINGNIWSIDNTGVTKMNSGVPDTQTGISFPVNSSEGWVCGGSIIRHFINGEWTAADQDYPSGGYNAIFMVDSLNGWIAGDGGIIAHTSDGQNWVEQTNPNQRTLIDIYFLNTNQGWAIGSGGTIVHTENGGTTWAVEADGITTHSFTGVHFTSPTNGYVVGNEKTLLKYTGVAVDENTDATLGSIQINSGELAGFNAQTLVYNLELPAGTTEIPNITVNATINEATVEITQATALPGTATILVTAKDGVTQQTYSIHFTVVTGIGDFEQQDELNIFPNPTAGKFRVPLMDAFGKCSEFKVEDATIELYDLNGRKLLEKQIPIGTENAEIIVSHLKSGMYFCKILLNGKIKTRKIIIQK